MLNFSNFKPVETANTKDNSHFAGIRKQDFDLKYKKFELKVKGKEEKAINLHFVMSNAMFDKLDLANKGAMEVINDGVSYLAIVSNEDAVFFKKTEKGEKGKVFKSTIFEKALNAQGVINKDLVGVNQNIGLTLVEGSETAKVGKYQTYGIYELSKGEASTEVEKEAGEVETASVPTTPAVEPAVAPEVTSELVADVTPEPAIEAAPAVTEAPAEPTATAPADDDF